MKIKTLLISVIIFILLAGSSDISASNLMSADLPAKEPWTKEYIVKYEGAQVGTHVSIAHHPKTGRAYVSYYDSDDGNLWMAYEVMQGHGDCPNNDRWNCVLIDDSADDVGQYSSIDVVYVQPASPYELGQTKVGIAYYNATERSLKYAEYRTGVMGPSLEIYTVDKAVTTYEYRGTHASMKFDKDNKAVIAYHIFAPSYNGYGAFRVADM